MPPLSMQPQAPGRGGPLPPAPADPGISQGLGTVDLNIIDN
jgi:hypothetical protein